MPPFWPKTVQNQIKKTKNINFEQLGLRRGLWGHSFKSSYSLELIFDFGKISFSGFYVFFLVPDIWYLIPDIWISGYLDIWISGYLDIWISGYLDIWTSGTWIPGYLIPNTFDQNTWWGSQIHGGEAIHGGQPTYMVAWPASRPALVGGQAR